jgi:hypothetical protein
VKVNLSIELSNDDDFGIVADLMEVLGRHRHAEPRRVGNASHIDVQGLLSHYWDEHQKMMGSPGEEDWKTLEARAQAEVYHRHLPQLIWEALYGAAMNFPAGSWWTASQLVEAATEPVLLTDIRQRLRGLARSRAVREYVEEVVTRLGLDSADKNVFDLVKEQALQWWTKTDGRVVSYTMSEELRDAILWRSDVDRSDFSDGDEREPYEHAPDAT